MEVILPNTVKPRITALDALRGLVMVIMALDHVRDFFHADAFLFQPEDLSRTTVILFFTRWITHLCAPLFMFTAGASAFFWRNNGRTGAQLSSWLWKRGLWLVFLELTVLRAAIVFNVVSGPYLLTVLWALGWSMVALALLSRLPLRVLAILSIATIALHNLADPVPFQSAIGKILHRNGVILVSGHPVVVAYPLIPWIAVMAAGFCFGRVLIMAPDIRQKWLIRLGLALTAGFLIMRGLNIYGDPQPWSVQKSAAFTVLSFLRCNKYPPSLDFLLMTLGPGLLLLAWFYRIDPRTTNPLVIIGRVPLFYFLVHISLAHLLTIPFALVRYGYAGFLLNPAPTGYPPGFGYSLGTVYLVWALVVAILYPLCVWFGKLKATSRSPLLAYL